MSREGTSTLSTKELPFENKRHWTTAPRLRVVASAPPQRLPEAVQFYSGPLVCSVQRTPERQVSCHFERPQWLTVAEFDLVFCKPPAPNAYINPFTSPTNVPHNLPSTTDLALFATWILSCVVSL